MVAPMPPPPMIIVLVKWVANIFAEFLICNFKFDRKKKTKQNKIKTLAKIVMLYSISVLNQLITTMIIF